LHARPGDSSARFLAVPAEQNATRTANVAPQARGVTPVKGKAGTKASRARKTAQEC